jgi:hypothetical protein
MRVRTLLVALGALCLAWSADVRADGHVLDTSEEGMKKIATALGVECVHCHTAKLDDDKLDFKAPSPFKATAFHMKQHFVDSLRTADGKNLECVSCHNGTAKFVPRDLESEEERLSATMERREVMALMRAFTKGLGVKCLFCHAKAEDGRMDPTVPTKNRRMARYMHDHFTQLTLLDGSPATCQTCHQGKAKFLPRHGE